MPMPSFKHFSQPSTLLRGLDLRRLPSQCVVCQSWPAQVVCQACWARFKPNAQAKGLQGRIERAGLAWNWSAALPYHYPWDGVIARFKFQQQIGLASHLAHLMLRCQTILNLIEGADYLLAVPIHAERLAQRGYNQSHLLALALTKAYARSTLKRNPSAAEPIALAGALLRLQAGLDQVGLSEHERWRNVKNQFMLQPEFSEALRGRRLLLVDDIMTTGATLHACMQALQPAQAATIDALTLAKTL